MCCTKNMVLIILMLTLTMILPSGVLADDFKITPSLGVRGEYHDNIFYASDNTEDDFITTIIAGLELIDRTERYSLDLSANLSPFFYADHSDLDDVDQKYLGKIDYKISSLFSINADAGYDLSNRPDRDIETTGIVYSSDRRKSQKYGLGCDYELSELSEMSLSLGYRRDKWDEITSERQHLKDYRAELNFSRDFSQWWESTKGNLNFGFSRYEFETSDSYNYFATIGAEHAYTETVNFIVNIGSNYTDADFLSLQPGGIVEINNSSFNGIGQATLEVNGELTRGSISIGYSIEPGSDRTAKRTSAALNLRRRVTEKGVIAIATGYYKNKAEAGDYSFFGIDTETVFFRPSFRLEFYDNFTLEASYRFAYTDDNLASDDTRSNRVYVQLAYGLPLFE